MSEPTITPINPVTLEALPEVAALSPTEVATVVADCRTAQQAWQETSMTARATLLSDFARLIVERRVEGAGILSKELGRPQGLCELIEFNNMVAYCQGVIAEGKIALKPCPLPLSAIENPGKKGVIESIPRGVIGVIAPWNYPVNNLTKSIFPALLSGNGVVFKPSEQTPASGAWLAALAAEVFPTGLVQVIQGRGEVGAALIEAGVDSMVFTGSVATGRKVGALAGERLIPCSLELGGKDAAIVLEDADQDHTALGVAQWSMFNSGQDCSSIERVYVAESIADSFIAKLGQAISKLRVYDGNNDAELGPLQNARQLELVRAHLEDAWAKGAQTVCGGEATGIGNGHQPTLLDHCTHEMRVMTEETFGPVVAVCRVKTEAEGLRLANDCAYGLNGSVWTRDLARGEALARQLEVGVCLVNNHSFTGSLPQAPWTGVKQTGAGIAQSRYAYGSFVRKRTVLVDKAKAPDPFWYPADASFHSFRELVAQKNLGGGIGNLIGLVKVLGKRVKAIRNQLSS